MHNVFHLKLDSTIEPNNNFFSLFNSEINREINSFFYTCPTKPFNCSLRIWMYPEELRRVLSLVARRSEYYEQAESEEENEEENEEESEEEHIINIEKSFKSDECIICLTNLPNVLFCNCGHLCICEECGKMKSLNTSPVCKTKNTIKRTV